MLPSDERVQFAQQVYALKSKHLQDMVDKRELTLRQGLLCTRACTHNATRHTTGVVPLLQAMVDDGVAVGVIAETNSSPDMRVVEAVLELLGDDLAAAVRVFPSAATPSESDSDDWEDVEEVGVGITLEQAVQQAQAKVCCWADVVAVWVSRCGLMVHWDCMAIHHHTERCLQRLVRFTTHPCPWHRPRRGTRRSLPRQRAATAAARSWAWHPTSWQGMGALRARCSPVASSQRPT